MQPRTTPTLVLTCRCNPSLWEKYFIICKPDLASLNKRNALTSSCNTQANMLLQILRSQNCWPTRRNIVGPHLLRAFAHHVVCCCMFLRLVGSCWMKFETGRTSEPTSANISIVSRSSKRGPTMLRSFAQHIQQCCDGARALHATYSHKYMRTRNKNGIGDRKRPRVLCFLI